MTGNNKTPRLKHKLTTADKERLHVLLRMRMIACGRREQVNRLVRGARQDSKVLTREELKNKITPQARAVVPVLIMAEIYREMELCHGPKIIDNRPRAERLYGPPIERNIPRMERNRPQIERNRPQMERNDPQVAPQVEQNVPQVAPQVEQNDPQVAPQVEQNYPQVAPQVEQNDPQVTPKVEQNDPQVAPQVQNIPEIEQNRLRIEQNGSQIAQVVAQVN